MATDALEPASAPLADHDTAGSPASTADARNLARTQGLTEPQAERVAGVVVRDARWLEAAYHAHASAVKTRLVALTSDPAAAEDLVQEVFMTAWRGLERFEGDDAGASPRARAWLLGIATNLGRNARRRRIRRWLRTLRRPALPPAPDQSTPESRLAARQSAQRLYLALSELPAEQAEAFGLRVLEGLTLEACSAALELPISTVSYRARRAEEKVRAALAKEDR